MVYLKVPAYGFYLFILFILQSSVFSTQIFGNTSLNFLFIFVIYLAFYAPFVPGLILIFCTSYLFDSASASTPYLALLIYLFTFISLKQLTNTSFTINQTSISLFTAIYFLLYQIVFYLVRYLNHELVTDLSHITYFTSHIFFNILIQPLIFWPLKLIDVFFADRVYRDQRNEELFFKASWWRS